MTSTQGRLEKLKAMAQEASVVELAHLFGDWVPLDNAFTPPRRRLFSPRAHLLALSVAGSVGRRCLP